MKKLLLLTIVLVMTLTVGSYAGNIGIDYGDAPESYSTLYDWHYPYSSGTGHHRTSDLRLGRYIDSEGNGQPSFDALGDGGDEDGIELLDDLVPGKQSSIQVSIQNGDGYLDAWIDFDQNGVFDSYDKLAPSYDMSNGVWVINDVFIPVSATLGATYARFRLSTAGGLSPTGFADDGEVEDYMVTIVPEPATMSLLGLGSLCFLRRKRENR